MNRSWPTRALAIEKGGLTFCKRRGLSGIFDCLGASDPALARVPPALEGHKVEAYFVYSKEVKNARRLTAFRDFLVKKVAEG